MEIRLTPAVVSSDNVILDPILYEAVGVFIVRVLPLAETV